MVSVVRFDHRGLRSALSSLFVVWTRDLPYIHTVWKKMKLEQGVYEHTTTTALHVVCRQIRIEHFLHSHWGTRGHRSLRGTEHEEEGRHMSQVSTCGGVRARTHSWCDCPNSLYSVHPTCTALSIMIYTETRAPSRREGQLRSKSQLGLESDLHFLNPEMRSRIKWRTSLLEKHLHPPPKQAQ